MKTLLVSLLLFSNVVFALDCSPINLITEPNSPFDKIPVTDQDGIGICYAYSLATMINYDLIKNGSQEREVSPFWIALAHAQTKERESIVSGTPTDSFEALRTMKNCSYQKVEDAMSVWAKKANVTEAEMVQALDTFSSIYLKKEDEKRAIAILNGKSSSFDALDVKMALDESVKKNNIYFCSSNPAWDNILPELQALSMMSKEIALKGILFPACGENKTSLKIPPQVWSVPTTDENGREFISSKLNSQRSPVYVGYCSQFLYDGNYEGISERKVSKTGIITKTTKKDCGGHASLVVGQKTEEGSCKFLLRNSWGNSFSKWTNNKKCLCKNKTTGEFVDDCAETTHNNGQYSVEGCWVDSDKLSKNTQTVTVLEGPASTTSSNVYQSLIP